MKYEQTLNAGKRKLAARLGSFLLIGCLSFQTGNTAVWAQEACRSDLEVPVGEMSGRLKSFIIDEREYIGQKFSARKFS